MVTVSAQRRLIRRPAGARDMLLATAPHPPTPAPTGPMRPPRSSAGRVARVRRRAVTGRLRGWMRWVRLRACWNRWYRPRWRAPKPSRTTRPTPSTRPSGRWSPTRCRKGRTNSPGYARVPAGHSRPWACRRYPILPGERGAPGWPVGVVGSMTHCDGYRGRGPGAPAGAAHHRDRRGAGRAAAGRGAGRHRAGRRAADAGRARRRARPALGPAAVQREGVGLQGVVSARPVLAGLRGGPGHLRRGRPDLPRAAAGARPGDRRSPVPGWRSGIWCSPPSRYRPQWTIFPASGAFRYGVRPSAIVEG